MTTPTPYDSPFIWAVGIEDTNVGWPLAGSATGLDEYEVTRHYDHWREDLALAASIGAASIRYGFPWYRVNPSRGQWDWGWTDEVVDEANRLGIGLIVDLVHYGTPMWLAGSFTDPDYPDAVAEYASAVAERYRGRVSSITPLNEPLVTASFVGLRGIWPPHETGEDGWSRVVVSLAEGIQRSIHAIRDAAPETQIVHVEATHVWVADREQLGDQLDLLDRKNYLPTDLVLGLVTPGHELHDWLLDNGIVRGRLDALVAGAARPDVIGVNYYPELSARELVPFEGSVVGVTFNAWTAGLESIIRGFHDRYGIPILVSETAVEGDDDHRSHWLDAVVALLHDLRAHALPVVGLVWWPLFDFVDWSWATGDQVIEEFYSRIDGAISPIFPPARGAGIDAYFRRMGLCRLEETETGDIRRIRTPVAEAFLRHSLASPSGTISRQQASDVV
jgi:beta-glucosidase/6-phospho-beta-glucosidase/beta-galactosidase